jgi:uncharacterized membrane protein YfcA
LNHADLLHLALLLAASAWAGVQNQLAGGGSFITLPALILTGMDARAANITSTVALFPGQITGGWMARKSASGAEGLSFKRLTVISLAGGAVGAVLLLLTSSSIFEKMVPWLVLFATGAFAWGSFGPKGKTQGRALSPPVASGVQFLIAIYGGYFGGGIGFLMLAALAMSGIATRAAAATKNILAGVVNFTAVLIFLFSGQVHWLAAGVACAGALVGSYFGARLLKRVNEKALRIAIVIIGLLLTVGLFVRSLS